MKTTRTAGLAGRAAAPDGGAEEADRLMMREGGRLAQRQDEQGAASGAVGRGELRVRGIRRAQLAAEFGDDVAEITSPSPRPSGLVVWKGVNRPASASALRPGPLSWK